MHNYIIINIREEQEQLCVCVCCAIEHCSVNGINKITGLCRVAAYIIPWYKKLK